MESEEIIVRFGIVTVGFLFLSGGYFILSKFRKMEKIAVGALILSAGLILILLGIGVLKV